MTSADAATSRLGATRSIVALNTRTEAPTQVCLHCSYARPGVQLLQLIQPGVAGLRFGVPFVGEATAADRVDEFAHDRDEVERVV